LNALTQLPLACWRGPSPGLPTGHFSFRPATFTFSAFFAPVPRLPLFFRKPSSFPLMLPSLFFFLCASRGCFSWLGGPVLFSQIPPSAWLRRTPCSDTLHPTSRWLSSWWKSSPSIPESLLLFSPLCFLAVWGWNPSTSDQVVVGELPFVVGPGRA